MTSVAAFIRVSVVLVAASSTSIAGELEVTLIRPTTYHRTTGSPDIFSVPFPARQGTGKLILWNGDESGNRRVTSAVVILNDKPVLGPSDFNQRRSGHEVSIDLFERNHLSVELRSAPGSFLTLKISQNVNAEGADVIEPEGGVVQVKDTASPLFGTTIFIPPDALSETSLISIHEPSFQPPLPENLVQGDTPVELLPSGLTFKSSVELSIPSNDQKPLRIVSNRSYFGD